ncbi:MAG: hypothetical protein KGL75_02685 [Acidobacteriota bacterium]|nr:hypothetical protein [Acidobacteriota bacterium]
MISNPHLRRLRAVVRAAAFGSAAALCVSVCFAPMRAGVRARGAISKVVRTQDDKSDAARTTKLHILVLTNEGKPVGNASVYVRFYTGGGLLHHDKLAELDLKTNQDGSVKVPPVPQGRILIQVIAKGWHTFGQWYDVDKDDESIEIKLEPPPHWY